MGEIILLSVMATAVFSLAAIFLSQYKKSQKQNDYTYWFNKVDDIL